MTTPDPESESRGVEWFALTGVFGVVLRFVVDRVVRRNRTLGEPSDRNDRG